MFSYQDLRAPHPGYQTIASHRSPRFPTTTTPTMTDHSLPAINASNPQEELEALIKRVTELSQMSLDMTRLCIDVQGVFLAQSNFFADYHLHSHRPNALPSPGRPLIWPVLASISEVRHPINSLCKTLILL